MEDFKKYFKFPLKMWDFLTLKVMTDDDKMAFDWMMSLTDANKNRVLAKINGETIVFKTKLVFRHEQGIIYVANENGEERKLCRIRGWGMLTGVGGYHLDPNYAAEIQDAFADYCVMMLNR